MKMNVGYSTNVDAFQSGVETAKMAGSAKLGLFFSSVVMDQNELVKGVKSIAENTKIIGCTSSAAIVVPDAGYLGAETGYSGMMAFDGEDLTVGVAASEAGENAREIGKKIAREAIKNA